LQFISSGKVVAKLLLRVYKPRFGPPALSKFIPRLIVPPISRQCWFNGVKPSIGMENNENLHIAIDSIRFLPENISVLRVTSSIFNMKSKTFLKGQDFNSDILLDQNAHSPSVCISMDLSSSLLNAFSMLILKVYTIEWNTNKLKLVGTSLFHLFLDLESEDIPTMKSKNVAQNHGAFQIPIFSVDFGKSELSKPVNFEKIPRVPCSTILIRVGSKEFDEVIPSYDSDIYHTISQFIPTDYEANLYHFVMAERKNYSIRDKLLSLEDIPKSATHTEESLLAWTKEQLTIGKEIDIHLLDISYIAKYDPYYGFKLVIDRACNLDAKTYPICVTSFTPSYFDIQNPVEKTMYKDDIVYTKSAVMLSSYLNPEFEDGFRWYRGRPFDQDYLAIIQVFGIVTNGDENGFLISHGWTILPIFQVTKYARHGKFKLPLFLGNPNAEVIQFWREGNLGLDEAMAEDAVSFTPHNSFIQVRICDGRRASELTTETKPKDNFLGSYSQRFVKPSKKSKPIHSLKPKKMSFEDYTRKVYNIFVEETNLPFVP
jgi:hypothetical protein